MPGAIASRKPDPLEVQPFVSSEEPSPGGNFRLSYVRTGLPPILTIHGDADKLVPHTQAVRLHEALTQAGVRNQLLTLPGAGHGGFTDEQELKAYEAVRAFLVGVGVIAGPK